MPPKKKPSKSEPSKRGCVCGSDCHTQDSHLPGLLLVAFGLLALPVNFGLIPGMEWALAWPLLIVLVGAVLVVKVGICRGSSS
jgi:LiaI-LiaF-like transmembrane region